MNKIIVIGNLGRDPEMRYTPNGQGMVPEEYQEAEADLPF